MNNYRRSRKIILTGATALRVLFLLVFFIAVATYFIWTGHSKLVNRADEYMTERYVERHSAKIDAADELLKDSNPSKALSVLEEAIGAMGNVNKQDRLATVYARALMLSLVANRQLKDNKAALEAARAHVEFDENDYRVWLDYSVELETSGKRKESLDAFYRAYKIAPHRAETAEPLAKYLYAASRFQEARQVVEAYNNKVHIGNFEFYWAVEGEDFSTERKRILEALFVDPGKPLKVLFSVNDDLVKRFRFDFPFVPSISVEILSITADTGDGRTDVDLRRVVKPGSNNMVKFEPYKYTITGYDPYFFFDLPQALKVNTIEVTYKFNMTPLNLTGAL